VPTRFVQAKPARLSACPLNLRQRFGLPVMPDFHGQREHQYDHSGDNSRRHSNVAVSQGHFGRGAPTYSCHQDDSNNPQQQAYRERKNMTRKVTTATRSAIPYQRGLWNLRLDGIPFLGYTFFAIASVASWEVR